MRRYAAHWCIYALALPAFFFFACSPGSADDNVAMVYVIGSERLQIMGSDITSVDLGVMRGGEPNARSAVRVCFKNAIHDQILQSVTHHLNLNDHFQVVVDCTVVEDMRLTSFEGTGNCNFFMSKNRFDSILLANKIRKGMTKSSCAEYVS